MVWTIAFGSKNVNGGAVDKCPQNLSLFKGNRNTDLLANLAGQNAVYLGMSGHRGPAPENGIEHTGMLGPFFDNTAMFFQVYQELPAFQCLAPVGTWMRTGMTS